MSASRILTRERIPPFVKSSVTLEAQHLLVQLVDSRTGILLWESEPMHNLVLNQGKEQLASVAIENIAAYAVVGTGNAAPVATDTGLQTELVRTNYNGGISDSVAEVSTGTFEFTRTRQFTAAQVANQNLTEWGFSYSNSAGANLAVRELFRDTGGNPVTITPGAGQDLRLIYKYRVSVGPTTGQAASINIAGIGVRTGQTLVFKNDLYGNPNIVNQLSAFMRGDNNQVNLYVYAGTIPLNYNAAAAPVPGSYPPSDSITLNWSSYTNGSRQRLSNSFVFDSSKANQTIKGLTVSQGNYGIVMIFQLDTGQEFTKDNLHSLTLDPWTINWS